MRGVGWGGTFSPRPGWLLWGHSQPLRCQRAGQGPMSHPQRNCFPVPRARFPPTVKRPCASPALPLQPGSGGTQGRAEGRGLPSESGLPRGSRGPPLPGPQPPPAWPLPSGLQPPRTGVCAGALLLDPCLLTSRDAGRAAGMPASMSGSSLVLGHRCPAGAHSACHHLGHTCYGFCGGKGAPRPAETPAVRPASHSGRDWLRGAHGHWSAFLFFFFL